MTNTLTGKRAEDIADHLLLGIADLDCGVDWVRERTSVTAAPGGSHPGAGTCNALLSLENRRYLEIIALDKAHPGDSHHATLVKDLQSPELVTWAVGTPDVALISRTAVHAGYRVEGPSDGSRTRQNGVTLRWKVLRILSEYGDVIPFFIEWGSGTTHPSQDSPAGCRLIGIEISHPEPDAVRHVLENFGISAKVLGEEKPRLRAILDTPKGKVRI